MLRFLPQSPASPRHPTLHPTAKQRSTPPDSPPQTPTLIATLTLHVNQRLPVQFHDSAQHLWLSICAVYYIYSVTVIASRDLQLLLRMLPVVQLSLSVCTATPQTTLLTISNFFSPLPLPYPQTTLLKLPNFYPISTPSLSCLPTPLYRSLRPFLPLHWYRTHDTLKHAVETAY